MVYKFEVGDKVRVLDGSDIEGYTGGWSMERFVGEVSTIRRLELLDGKPCYRLSGDCLGWFFDERGLELVTESTEGQSVDLLKLEIKVMENHEPTKKLLKEMPQLVLAFGGFAMAMQNELDKEAK